MGSDEKLGRRRWLGAIIPAAVDAAAEVLPSVMAEPPAPQRRPPGALAELQFLSACTSCGECVSACPHLAIHVFKPDTGERAGTPVMLPDKRPCHMCEGFPCIAACEPGALKPLEQQTWRLGLVQVDPEHCLPYRGPECGACIGHCPTPTPAIKLVRNKPEVSAEDCVGCGLCIEACPTSPKALVLLPL